MQVELPGYMYLEYDNDNNKMIIVIINSGNFLVKAGF